MDLAATIQQLYQQYGQCSGITIECQNELIAIGIKNKAASAEVFLQGAQITRYQQANKAPLLFLSDACTYQQGSPLRGGIPICWPWFGDLAKNPQAITQQIDDEARSSAPAHGFVRKSHWEVKQITTPSPSLTIVELCFHTSGDNPLWPYRSDLLYRIEIGERLSASLSVSNSGTEAFVFSGALHTYLAVSDIHKVAIKGFDQSRYIDALDDWQQKQHQGDIRFDKEVDRIYQAPCIAATVIDSERTLNISSLGSKSTVVWNPWIEKSAILSQFCDEEYQQMVCVETANALEDMVYLAPGQKHLLGVHLF